MLKNVANRDQDDICCLSQLSLSEKVRHNPSRFCPPQDGHSCCPQFVESLVSGVEVLTLSEPVITTLVIDWTSVPRCNTFPAPAHCPLYNANLTTNCMPPLSGNGVDTQIGGAYWHCPGPFVQPFDTKGPIGSTMGVFTVLIQVFAASNCAMIVLSNIPRRHSHSLALKWLAFLAERYVVSIPHAFSLVEGFPAGSESNSCLWLVVLTLQVLINIAEHPARRPSGLNTHVSPLLCSQTAYRHCQRTILYVLAVVAAGLVVPSNHPDLGKAPLITGSPWTIAYTTVTGSNAVRFASPFSYITDMMQPRYILMILFMLSALSAASADIWVASRYLFFLARRGHAPLVFGSLYKSDYKTPILPFEGRRSTGQLISEGSWAISPTDASPDMRALSLTGMIATEPLLPYTPTLSRPSHTRTASSLSGGVFGSPASPESTTALLQPHRKLSSLSGPVTLPAISLMTPAPPDEHGVRPSALTAPTSTAVVLTTPPRSRPPTGQSVSSAISQPLTVRTTTTRPNTGQSAATTSTDPNCVVDGSAGKIPPSAHSLELSPSAPTLRRGPRLRRAHRIAPLPPPDVVVPWIGVLFGGAIALLVFMAPESDSDKKVKKVRLLQLLEKRVTNVASRYRPFLSSRR